VGVNETAENAAVLRVGRVTGYTGGVITVAISGSDVLANAAYLTRYNPTVGDLVVVLRSGASWVVLDSFATTPGRFVPVSGTVATYESTASVSFTNLTTVGPTLSDVVIGSSGRLLLFISALINIIGASDGQMGVDITGATVLPATFQRVFGFAGPAGSGVEGTRLHLLEGLNPGPTTFVAKYASLSGVSVDFARRNLTAVVL
jgi:hypothetical protein